MEQHLLLLKLTHRNINFIAWKMNVILVEKNDNVR